MKKFTIQMEKLKTTRFCIFTKTFLNDDCPICFDNILPDTRVKAGCNHSFCISCFKEHIIYSEDKKELTCPCCRKSITHIKLLNKIEMRNIRNLVNVPQTNISRQHNDRESRFSEIRIYQRRQGQLVVSGSSDARI
jgi:hypothetical protein